MGFPLYLAMTAAEMTSAVPFPACFSYMACHFSPYGEGITNVPEILPKDSILILNDRMPCQGHSPDLVSQQLTEAVFRLGCESVLLDFLHPPDSESEAMVSAIVETLPCPVAVSAEYAKELSCPVFLSPSPLHVPLEAYVAPWKGREIWLEAALCQEKVTITKGGQQFAPVFPTSKPDGGFYDEGLCCGYRIDVSDNCIEFTLFDTPESLLKKLEAAGSLGVSRAVGLYQELGTFLAG